MVRGAQTFEHFLQKERGLWSGLENLRKKTTKDWSFASFGLWDVFGLEMWLKPGKLSCCTHRGSVWNLIHSLLNVVDELDDTRHVINVIVLSLLLLEFPRPWSSLAPSGSWKLCVCTRSQNGILYAGPPPVSRGNSDTRLVCYIKYSWQQERGGWRCLWKFRALPFLSRSTALSARQTDSGAYGEREAKNNNHR